MKDDHPITIRRAGPADAEPLARLHFVCSSAQPGGFMHHLGRKFFVRYYQLILSLRTSVVLCADAGREGIVGLISATLDSKEQLEAIRKRRFRLLQAAIPSLIQKPKLLWAVYTRNRSLSADALGKGFIVGSGARIVYWGWRPGYPSQGRSTCLLKELMALARRLGTSRLQLEVDRLNRKVEVVHRLMGAQVVEKFSTRDGRERLVMEYELNRAVS